MTDARNHGIFEHATGAILLRLSGRHAGSTRGCHGIAHWLRSTNRCCLVGLLVPPIGLASVWVANLLPWVSAGLWCPQCRRLIARLVPPILLPCSWVCYLFPGVCWRWRSCSRWWCGSRWHRSCFVSRGSPSKMPHSTGGRIDSRHSAVSVEPGREGWR